MISLSFYLSTASSPLSNTTDVVVEMKNFSDPLPPEMIVKTVRNAHGRRLTQLVILVANSFQGAYFTLKTGDKSAEWIEYSEYAKKTLLMSITSVVPRRLELKELILQKLGTCGAHGILGCQCRSRHNAKVVVVLMTRQEFSVTLAEDYRYEFHLK